MVVPRIVLALLLVVPALAACAPAVRAGSLPPTLSMTDADGGPVAVQNGIPVPTFEFQPRPRIDLDGTWRVETSAFDSGVSLTDRDSALPEIVAAAAGRERPGYDDSRWDEVDVPGAINPPPDARTQGAWYRRSFSVPATWAGLTATLKFGAVNYVGDVWLNGVYLGYHEGGYTPFAFDATAALLVGRPNLLAVRADNPPWGSRNDIVPWGLTDWWNYGGITRPVWLEATPPIHAVRADVVPHLDGADVSVVVRNAAIGDAPGVPPSGAVASSSPGTDSSAATTSVRLQILPAQVTPDNVADPDVRRLLPGLAQPLAEARLDAGRIGPHSASVVEARFRFGGADHWSPGFPALYVLRVTVEGQDGTADELWTSFGLRRVQVDPAAPRILLNGSAVMFNGVGLHDEALVRRPNGTISGGRVQSADVLLAQLDRARRIGANLIRTAHTPANPLLLTLADRLGFAVWEEIPLYHFTPLTFGVTMGRGIPQQMLREMALRDMNRPSVLFHGLANESTGAGERTDALTQLRDIDRAIDGTRLTGQAAYGSQPDDATQAPLDVAGFTFYYGVFYGDAPASGTEQALLEAHAANPDKPILALEFGRWADGAAGEEAQRSVFRATYPVFDRHADRMDDGFVAAATWWTLQDFLTMRPGISVEHFGLFDEEGRPRPVADAAAAAFTSVGGAGARQQIRSTVRRARVDVPREDWSLAIQIGYALAVGFGLLALVLLLLILDGGRATRRRAW